ERMFHDPFAGRTGEGVYDLDIAGQLEAGETFRQPKPQSQNIKLNPRFGLDEKFDIGLANIRRNADHGTVFDLRVCIDDPLDLPGRHVVATRPHTVGRAAVELKVSVRRPGPYVSGVEPASSPGTGGCRRLVEIAGEQWAFLWCT